MASYLEVRNELRTPGRAKHIRLEIDGHMAEHQPCACARECRELTIGRLSTERFRHADNFKSEHSVRTECRLARHPVVGYFDCVFARELYAMTKARCQDTNEGRCARECCELTISW